MPGHAPDRPPHAPRCLRRPARRLRRRRRRHDPRRHRAGRWTVAREVKSGRGTYNSHDSRTLHFGLGDLGCDYTVEVRWPDGTAQTYGPAEFPVGRHVTLDYTEGVLVDP